MTTKIIDSPAVFESLKKIVAEQPLFTYQILDYDACVYSTPAGEPSCIVGHWLHREDVEAFERVHEQEWDDGGPNAAGVVRALKRAGLESTVSFDARRLLSSVQARQDLGYEWGAALLQAALVRGVIRKAAALDLAAEWGIDPDDIEPD